MVRTSVFGWRTFHDLWLTGDQFMGKVSTMGQPTRPSQPSIPSGSHVITWITGWRPLPFHIMEQTRAAYGGSSQVSPVAVRPFCL